MYMYYMTGHFTILIINIKKKEGRIYFDGPRKLDIVIIISLPCGYTNVAVRVRVEVQVMGPGR